MFMPNNTSIIGMELHLDFKKFYKNCNLCFLFRVAILYFAKLDTNLFVILSQIKLVFVFNKYRTKFSQI